MDFTLNSINFEWLEVLLRIIFTIGDFWLCWQVSDIHVVLLILNGRKIMYVLLGERAANDCVRLVRLCLLCGKSDKRVYTPECPSVFTGLSRIIYLTLFFCLFLYREMQCVNNLTQQHIKYYLEYFVTVCWWQPAQH